MFIESHSEPAEPNTCSHTVPLRHILIQFIFTHLGIRNPPFSLACVTKILEFFGCPMLDACPSHFLHLLIMLMF
jgi:hypothetical protein